MGEPTATVARRAARGAVALGVRQVAVQGANVAGSVVLARLLSPGAFGSVGIASFAMGAAVALSSLGLGASLVREPDEPDDADCRTVLTVQLAIAGTLALTALGVAAALAPSRDAARLIACGAVALIGVPLSSVPLALLERRLDFAAVARIEAAQAFAYNGVAVALAWRGFGVLAIGPALVVRAAVGALLARRVSPRPIRPGWSPGRLGRHLRFGLPLFGAVAVSHGKDALVPLLLGATAGAAAVGAVGWAQLVAAAPSLALMILARVYLPAFARLQDDRAALARLVAEALRATHALVAPLAVLTFVLIDPITRLVFGAQWLPALPVFRLLWVANLFAPTATVLVGVVGAVGRARTTFRFALAAAAATWLLGTPLVLVAGGVGFAIANVAVQATQVLLVRAVREEIPVAVLRAAAPVWCWAAVVGVGVRLLAEVVPPADVPLLAAYGALGVGVYVAGLAVARPARIRGIRVLLGEGA